MECVIMQEKKEFIRIILSGRIDSINASQVEKEVMDQLDGKDNISIELDASGLEYISSSGLRVILRLRKQYHDISITGVNSGIYEILDMTGFTEMMQVVKAYRVVSVDGCEEIGRGANGTIYRIDRDTVVKVYKNADALEDIRHEREMAKLALVLGIPTAISYDVVRVGESYGSVFELLNASSFSRILAEEPEKMDWCVHEYVNMLKKIHSTAVPGGKLPDMKEKVLGWVEFLQDHLPEDACRKLRTLIEGVPQDDHMLHGDYHTKNLELQNGEVLLIDMDTLAVGHPIFELGFIYGSFVGFSEVDHEVIRRFQGFDHETGIRFWRKSLAAYLGTDDEEKIREVENKARVIAYIRLIRRSIRRGKADTEEGRAEISFWKQELLSLLEKTDTLLFTCNELLVEAVREKLPEVISFIRRNLETVHCPEKSQMQIIVAVEEIFVNIADYAYAPEKGRAMVCVEFSGQPLTITITFLDNGVPYDPLAHQDPDVTASAEDRSIGGLGILITKKTMDEVAYEYKNGQNVLKLKKQL